MKLAKRGITRRHSPFASAPAAAIDIGKASSGHSQGVNGHYTAAGTAAISA